MSRPITIENNCYVCGQESCQTVLASTNRFGYPDLDLRPPEMERSTMKWWIQKCPHCGYVSYNISNETKITLDWLQNEQYLLCDNINFVSSLAKDYYKLYLIAIANNTAESAFRAALYAAWCCDDSHDVENAIYCRKKALEQAYTYIDTANDTFVVVCADLLRRTGQFELLIEKYKDKTFVEETLNAITKFQIERAYQKDTNCYTLGDVLQNE